MGEPDLSRIVESFVRVGPADEPHGWQHLVLLRTVVGPVVKELRAKGLIGWFSFLIHSGSNGVPTQSSDRDTFWHLRMELLHGCDLAALLCELPGTFEMTQQADRALLEAMSVPDPDLLVAGIGGAWRILGDQSALVLNMLDAYRVDAPVEDGCPPCRSTFTTSRT